MAEPLGSRRVVAALLVVLVLGGALRVAWVAHAGVTPHFSTDPQAYLLQGETIARGHGYADPLVEIENQVRRRAHEAPIAEQPASFYPPGYPAFIAAVAWTVWHTPLPDGDLVRTIEYVQVLLGVLTIFLVFLLARRVFDSRVALIAAAIVAFYPNLIATTATLQFETVFITLLLAVALLILALALADEHRVVRLAGSGLAVGLVSLIHPTVCLLVVAFLAARLAMHRPRKEVLRDFAILTLGMLVVVGAWTVRNAVELHAFVPTATGAGPALCMARNPEATGSISIPILEHECQPAHLTSTFAKRAVAVDQYATSHAIRWVIRHPLSEVRMWGTRTRLAYAHDTSGLDAYAPNLSSGRRKAANTVSDDVSFVVLALAIVGLVLAIAKRRGPATIFLVVTTLGLAAVPAILFGDPRYRVPAEPFFAIFAAVTLSAAAGRRASSWWRAPAAARARRGG